MLAVYVIHLIITEVLSLNSNLITITFNIGNFFRWKMSVWKKTWLCHIHRLFAPASFVTIVQWNGSNKHIIVNYLQRKKNRKMF